VKRETAIGLSLGWVFSGF